VRLAFFPLMLTLAACSASGPVEQCKAGVNIFVGELESLNGELVQDTKLGIRLYSKTGDFEAPDYYFIAGGCLDAGFLDKADGRFWSGSSPAKNPGLPVASPARRGEIHCPPDDSARYVRLLEIMYEGPTLKFDGASATFTAPTKGSAVFRLGPVYAD